MKMDVKMIVSVILALAGLYYVLAPHNLHVSSGFGFGLEHSMHMTLGVLLLVVAGGYYMMMGKKTKRK